MAEQRTPTGSSYGETLCELGRLNENVFVLDADLVKASGTKAFKEAYPDRHINVGIAEQNLVGVGAGIAAAGAVPFVNTMANFLAKRACDQVAISVGYNKLNVKLVGCYAGLTQEDNGGTHVSFMDIAIMRCVPNITVVAPGDICELRQAITWAADYSGPVYVRVAKLLRNSLLGEDHQFEIGKAYRYGSGRELTIVSTGLATEIALDSLDALKAAGIEGQVLHVPTIKPLDEELLIASVRETGACLTVEDHSVFGGLGSAVAETLGKHCPTKIVRLGMNDSFGLTAKLDFQLEYFGITPENIVMQAKSLLEA